MSVAYQVHAIKGLGRAVRAGLSNLMPPTPITGCARQLDSISFPAHGH